MSKAFKAVKKILPAALPIAASFIPGIGPLGMALAGAAGGALGGGGIKGALMGAALSGLGAGALGSAPGTTGIGIFDSLNKGLFEGMSPLRSMVSSVGKGLGDTVGNIFGPLTSSAGSSSTSLAAPVKGMGQISVSDLGPITGGTLPWQQTASEVLTQPASGGLLSSLGDKISNLGLSDIATAASLVQALNPQQPEGTLSQADVVARMDAQQAAEAQKNAEFISNLNSAPIQRDQTDNKVDYYNYGSRPENLFFEDVGGGRTNFKKGGIAGGQDDTIKANLSVGEYVIPADVVSSLGDGSTDAGASRLDQLIAQIRKQKAPDMEKGALPKKASNPLAYMGAMA